MSQGGLRCNCLQNTCSYSLNGLYGSSGSVVLPTDNAAISSFYPAITSACERGSNIYCGCSFTTCFFTVTTGSQFPAVTTVSYAFPTGDPLVYPTISSICAARLITSAPTLSPVYDTSTPKGVTAAVLAGSIVGAVCGTALIGLLLYYFVFAKASASAAAKAAKLAEVAGNSEKIPSQFTGDNDQHIQAQNNQVQQYGQATRHPGVLRANIPILGDDDSNNDDHRLNRDMHHKWHRDLGIDERQRNGNGEEDPVMAGWAQLPRRVASISSSEAVGPTPSLQRVLSQRSAVNLSPGLTAGLYPSVVVASTTSYTPGDPPARTTPSPSSSFPQMSTPSSPERRNPGLYTLSTSFIEPSEQQRSYTEPERPSAANLYASANAYYRGYAEPSGPH